MALTSREKFDRLRTALRSERTAASTALATKLDACGHDWNGRFRCRSPACPTCKRANVRHQQRSVREFYQGAENAELALMSVVLPGTRDVDDISRIMARGYEGARKRIAARRARSCKWDDVHVTGWFEIDAIGAHQFPHLPPQRRTLLSDLAPMSFDQTGPTWLPTFHAICYLGPLHIGDMRDAFSHQWKLARQVDLTPFDSKKPVDENLDSVTAYANKFEAETTLQDRFVDPWPLAWQADLFTWLDRKPRNTFEFMRFTIGQKANPIIIDRSHPDVELEPMPVTHSFSRVPMSYNTGGRDALGWY